LCAILGYIGNINESRFKKALNLMSHRGKDFQNILKTNFGIFGFNRLEIEESINNQPLFKDNVVVMFNGEIYNYKDLIKRFKLNANDEIEVLFCMWKRFGVDFVKYLDGMFAIAIFDKKLYLFRDIFGKKPLYFTSNAFASEIKALLEFTSKKLNLMAVSEFFMYNSSLAVNTMFEGVYKLPAGCYFDGEIKRYYDFEYFPKEEIDESKIEGLLFKSINKRFHGKVEIGSLLSGGVDSSLIAALVSKNRKLKTFSIGYRGYENYDERKFARIVANHLKTEHYEIEFTKKDFFDEFENVLFFMDEVKGDSSYFAVYFLAKNIPLKVVFSGEGSDELFLGYKRYSEYLGFLNSFLPNKRWLKKYLERYPEDVKEWELFRRFFADEDVFRGINEIFYQRQVNKLIKKSFKVDYKRYIKKWGSFGLTYFDLKVWLLEVLMMKLDKMFMSNTIEVRTPFLDKELVEYVFSLKKMPKNKEVIKNIAIKYLPKEIVYRRKKGFIIPFYEWLKEENELKRIVDINRKSKLFNEEYVKEIIKSGHKRYKQHIWHLYVFSRWFEKNFL